MRQAGRYMPDYRALRERYALHELFHRPELALQVALMPLKSFHLDAAILFSDILVVAEMFGRTVHFPEGGVPCVDPPVRSAADVDALQAAPAEEALGYVGQALRMLRQEAPVPVLGFSGAPFTVASYLIGHDRKNGCARAKEWMYADPASFHRLLRRVTDALLDLLLMQVRAGAQALQIFDSWAGALPSSHFAACSLQYLKRLLDGLAPSGVPVILFCKGSSLHPEALCALNPRAISFDCHQELSVLRRSVPSSIAVQGNLDPDLLKAPPRVIQDAVERLLASMEGDPGFVVNLGHGILPETPMEGVRAFVDAVHHFASGGMEQRIASGLPPD
jgi:uroporphyrinogen decarboxylase